MTKEGWESLRAPSRNVVAPPCKPPVSMPGHMIQVYQLINYFPVIRNSIGLQRLKALLTAPLEPVWRWSSIGPWPQLRPSRWRCVICNTNKVAIYVGVRTTLGYYLKLRDIERNCSTIWCATVDCPHTFCNSNPEIKGLCGRLRVKRACETGEALDRAQVWKLTVTATK